MTKSNRNLLPSRRALMKGVGALAAGVAAQAFLRVRSAYAAYPERTVKVVVANTPGGPSDLVGRMITAALQQSTVAWSDLRWIRDAWNGRLVIKGVLTGDDARRAIDAGARSITEEFATKEGL